MSQALPAPPVALATRAAAPPAIELRGLTKTFSRVAGGPPVLDRIDLRVAEGEFVCLVGASGCGKSTLLNLIAGLDTATAGEVDVRGARPALMFQEAALFPWLTAAGNVELALKLGGVGRRERRDEARRLLGLVRLTGVESRRVHHLSGGMRQRVALARALAQRSPVLLMDEPFGALDAITRDVLHEELTRIWADANPTGFAERGPRLTIVFVTHNVREAVRLGGRVVLLSSRPGRIVREWRVALDGPRRIESAAVAELSAEIVDRLREEISRHGQR
jgi:NitT/TauT family transport system ATP-binding protein